MSRKVTLKIEATVVIEVDEGVDMHDVLSEFDLISGGSTSAIDIVDFTVDSHKVIDSK